MSDIHYYFKAIEINQLFNEPQFNENQLGSLIVKHTEGEFPELDDINIAIIGVCEDRNSINNTGSNLAPDEVRTFLYKLYAGSFEPKVADLGNIMPGKTVNDTYFALRECVEVLIKRNIVPVIIGGSQDITYAQFLGYKNLEQTINMVAVDSVFDLGNPDDEINNNMYITIYKEFRYSFYSYTIMNSNEGIFLYTFTLQ